jgi:hypothetical protein
MVSCIAKPRIVTVLEKSEPSIPKLHTIELRDIAAALLDQTVGGFEKARLFNDDLIRIAQKALSEGQVVDRWVEHQI